MKIIAHRGLSEYYPENSLIAFEEAIKVGVDGIETDIRLSVDGVPFIFHDSSLKRITGKDEPLEAQESSYLKTLDIGSWMDARFSDQRLPTLQELLELIDGRVMLILEIKYHSDTYEAVCKSVTPHIANKLSWVEVSSFSDEIIMLMHQLNPELRIHKLIDETKVLEEDGFDEKYAFTSYFDIDVNLKDHPKTFELMKEKKVIFWTVDKEDLSSYIEGGLLGAMSNDPQSLKTRYY